MNTFKRKRRDWQKKQLDLKEKTQYFQEKLQQKEAEIRLLQHETEKLSRHSHQVLNMKQELNSLNSQRNSLLEEAYVYSEIHAKIERIIQDHLKYDTSAESFDKNDWKQLVLEIDKHHKKTYTFAVSILQNSQ